MISIENTPLALFEYLKKIKIEFQFIFFINLFKTNLNDLGALVIVDN